MGFDIGWQEVETGIQGYLAAIKHPKPIKNGIHVEGWWLGFLKCHPKLVHCKLQQLRMTQAKATCQVVIDHWFNQCLEPTLTKLKLKQHPKGIYNVDESDFPLSSTSSMILTNVNQVKRHEIVIWYKLTAIKMQ